jgi:hypothetical protein
MKLNVKCVLIVGVLAIMTPRGTATSLDVLEEMAQQEAIGYMKTHNMDIQHGPAILSGSFKEIVLSASFIEKGEQKVITFHINPNYDKNGSLPIKSVKIQ